MRFATTIVLAAATLAVGCSSGNGQVIRLDGDLAQLERQYRQQARRNPGDAAALARLGAVLHKRGKSVEAIGYLSRAAGLNPSDPEVARWRGEALLAAKRPIDAHRAFARALELDPDWRARYRRNVEPRLVTALAEAAAGGKNVKRILDLVGTLDADLLGRHPKAAARLYEAQGDKMFSAGANHQAISAYERALSTGRASGEVRFKLGRCHAVLRHLDRADAQFKTYIDGVVGDKRTDRVVEIAAFLEQRFLFDQARTYYERAVKLRPADAGLQRALGVVLLKEHKWDRAKAVFDKMLAGSKEAKVYIDVAQLYLKFKRVDASIATWRKAIELAPDDVGQWRVLAHLLKDKGRLDELEGAIGHPQAHERWGDVYVELRDYERAVARFRKATASGGGPVWVKLGVALHRLDRAAERDKAFQTYVKTAADRDVALAAVADAYQKVGESARALATWKQLALSDPANRAAAFALARLYRGKRDVKAEGTVLIVWAGAQPNANARAGAWLDVARYHVRRRDGGAADAAVSRALAEGQTQHRREAYMVGADVHHKLLGNHVRAEELYLAWIDSAAPKERYEALRKIARLVQGKSAMRRFRNRLLEDMVRDKPDDARTYYSLGESYLSSRPPQRREAGEAFARFIELSKDARAATLQVGLRLTQSNAFRAAARVYSKLAVDEIDDPRLHLALSRLYLRGQVNNKKRARAHLLRYLDSMGEASRSETDQLFRLAGQLMNRGLNDVSVAIYRRLLPNSRNKTRILKPLGSALLALGQEEEADEVFRSYLEATSRGPQAIKHVAEAFYNARFYRRAKVYYELMFNARARARLGRTFPKLFDIYAKLGDKAGLLDLANRFVKLSPNARSYSEAARRLEQAGMLREALSFWGSAAEKQPGAHFFREAQASLALRLGEVDAAERHLSQLISNQGGKAVAWVRAGRLLAERGFDDRALKLYDVALNQGTEGGPIHLARAQILLRQGKFDEAHADFAKALTRADNLDKVLGEVRTSYLRSGQVARYVDLLRRASALFPGRSSTHLELGEMALTMGRMDEARQSFGRYVDSHEKGVLKVAAMLWRAGDLEGARRFYERALSSSLLDSRQKALSELLAALAALGRPEAVPEAISRFLVASANPREDLKTLARVLEEGGYVRDAIRYYERVLNGVAVGEGQYRLGRLWLAVRDTKRAKQAFERHIRAHVVTGPRVFRNDRSSALLEWAARVRKVALEYESAGQDALALELLARSCRERPELGQLHVHRARVLLMGGDVLGAVGALEGLVRNRTVDPLVKNDLEALEQLLRQLGREKEALDVLRRTAPSNRSSLLSLAIVRLALRLGKGSEAREEVARIFEQSPHGALRLFAGLAYFRAGMYLEATEHLLDTLEPGRGGGSVDEAVRALLVIARLRNDPALLTEVSARVGRFFEDRRKYHQVMTHALLETGYLDEAAGHAAEWVAAVGQRPSGRKLNSPAQPSPWRALVMIQLRRGDTSAAMSASREYIAAAQDAGEARRAMAKVMQRHMAYPQALTLFEEAATADHSDRPSRFAAAVISLELGDLARARGHFDVTMKTGDDKDASVRRAAQAYATHGYVDEAEALYAQASSPPLGTTRQRAMMWLRKGDIARAKAAIKIAVDGAVDPVVAQARFAAVYLTSGLMPAKMALALADETLARRTAPHPVAQLVRASALAELGRAPEAKRMLETVLARGGADDLAVVAQRAFLGPRAAIRRSLRLFAGKALAGQQINLAKWALDQTLVDGGLRARLRGVDTIRRALDEDTTWSADAATALARVAFSYLEPMQARSGLVLAIVDRISALHERAGDLEAAVHTYHQALRRFPEHAHLHNNLAYLLARRDQRLGEALERVRHARRLSPSDNLAYLDTEGWVLFKQGKYEHALALVQAAIRHMTDDHGAALAESLYHLGAIYQKLGQADKAREALRRATRKDPGGVYGRKAFELLKVLELP